MSLETGLNGSKPKMRLVSDETSYETGSKSALAYQRLIANLGFRFTKSDQAAGEILES